MAGVISLAEAKAHLRIDPDSDADDILLGTFLDGAERACERKIGVPLTSADFDQADLPLVAQSILLLVGHWWRNRASVSVDARSTPVEMPMAVGWLLEPITRQVIA